MATFAQLLVNSKLPSKFKFSGVANKKSIYNTLTDLAKKQPQQYSDYVQHIKETGDFFATNEGITVGLDDIEPDYKKRDELIRKTKKDLAKLKTPEARKARIMKAQEEGLALTMKHPGSLTKMTLSGGRGNPGQLVKTLVSPITVKGPDDTPTDFLMTRSYSEGVKPAEFWMGASEARREAAKGNLATALPGDTAKQLVNTLNKVTITKRDCGTDNGILLEATDENIIGRYIAGSNQLITTEKAKELSRGSTRRIKVRSPLTCEAQPGVCQMCFGIAPNEKPLDIGTNYGVRVAHAMSEPLTQMVLSSKHGGNMSKIDDGLPSGMMGFRQVVDVPKIFKNEATLATTEGRITKIEKLPHGGHDIYIGQEKHFAHPGRNLKVRRGDYVGKGDPLTDGVPNPKKVLGLEGLGSGRKYLVDTIHQVYADSGVNMDKRHIETMVREDLNYVKVNKSDANGEFLRNEIVPYNRVKPNIQKTSIKHPFNKSIIGKTLGQDFLEYTAGTEISPKMYEEIRTQKPTSILISEEGPAYEPIMTALERVPTMTTDVIGRLNHRRLKDTLLEGVARGYETDKRTSPVANYIFGQ
jgi:DNA-directed RNA polymerase subunit beta'